MQCFPDISCHLDTIVAPKIEGTYEIRVVVAFRFCFSSKGALARKISHFTAFVL